MILAVISPGARDVLAVRVYPGGLRLQRGRMRRTRRLVRRREREYAAGTINAEELARSVRAVCGALTHIGLRGMVASEVAV